MPPTLNALLLENIHPDAALRLRASGFDVRSLERALGPSELGRALKGVAVLGIRSKTRLTKEVLRSAPDLLAVGAFCVGTDNADLPACTDTGVAVFNAPFSNTRSVAELAIGEVIMLLRGVFEKSRRLHAGIWDKSSAGAREVRGKKLGIVGYGNIGAQAGLLAEGLGMEVLYFDLLEKLSMGNAKRCRSMAEVLQKADALTVHVDDRPRNAGLIGEAELRLLKPGAVFLNLSRGRVVDLKALARALKDGRIAGAAVDVFPEEPSASGDPFRCGLQDLPNVILTPHIGGSTLEAQRNIAAYVSDKLAQYARAGDSFYSVNFPQVQLPILQGQHRLLHVHRNVPGVMSQINTILASNGINITGQYLETNERIGYAITDIPRRYAADVLDELRGVRATIRLRALY
ncbi:MAG TPA: phosphoglycerate dehydrogenase [Elusimicrobia bacterium]|nr:phosphoglycerate dehydrogenase [Elusimicrobiota bacterium]